MTVENQARERERLTKLYAEMSEGELQKVASEAADLTEVARGTLADEITHRGLAIRLADYASGDDAEFQNLVTISRFRDLPEALLAKGSLDSAGIESFLADDNMVRMNWLWSNFLGGVRLEVKPEDVETASEVLNQPIPAGFEVEAVGQYEQPRCPKCESLQVTFEALHKPIACVSMYVGIPLPIPRNSWKCESCGHRWDNTPDSDLSPPASDEAAK